MSTARVLLSTASDTVRTGNHGCSVADASTDFPIHESQLNCILSRVPREEGGGREGRRNTLITLSTRFHRLMRTSRHQECGVGTV